MRAPVLLSVLFILALACGLPSYALDPEAPGVFVRVVDVGSGHCAIVQVTKESGWTDCMLFDGGNYLYNGNFAYDEVRRIFHKHNVIQLVVMSHTDSDHVAAIPRILDDYTAKRILRSGYDRPNPAGFVTRAQTAAEDEGNQPGVRDINLNDSSDPHGTTYAIGDATVTLLSGFGSPPADWDVSGQSKKRNSVSIVLRLEYAGRSILFTGDAVGRHDGDSPTAPAIATEKYLLANQATRPLASDVIIAPHHGADNASALSFIQAVAPTYVIFPSGSNFGHPRIRTVNRYKRVTSVQEIFRTDLGDNTDKGTQWSWGRRTFGDNAGDDHVDIHISPDGDIEVEYANPSSHNKPYVVSN